MQALIYALRYVNYGVYYSRFYQINSLEIVICHIHIFIANSSISDHSITIFLQGEFDTQKGSFCSHVHQFHGLYDCKITKPSVYKLLNGTMLYGSGSDRTPVGKICM